MNVVQQPKADSTLRHEAFEPEAVTRVQGGVWGAAPTRRYDDLAAPYRPIFRRIREAAVQRERDRALPFEQIRWLKEAGFGALRAPKDHGGGGATLPEAFALLAELAEADFELDFRPFALTSLMWRTFSILAMTRDGSDGSSASQTAIWSAALGRRSARRKWRASRPGLARRMAA